LYCYSRCDLVQKKIVKSYEEWLKPRPNKKHITEKPKKLDGRIMFPTSHDIHDDNIERVLIYLKQWLKAGNEILITSKPRYSCIRRICLELFDYKDQIVFRFTIGSTHNDTLKFWEPNAPTFQERLKSLETAKLLGFETSVSCEPYLDASIINIVEVVSPYVTDTVWVGKMNQIERRVDTTGWTPEDFIYLKYVKDYQTDEQVKKLYEALKGNPKVRWKDSIKKVLGLPEEDIG